MGARLTHDAMPKLVFNHMLAEPLCLDFPRPLPYQDMTTLELMVAMRQKGWTWAQLPAKVADRSKLAYKVGEALVWYTSGVTVNNAYLCCLLTAEELLARHQIDTIPHGLSAEIYEAILKGVQPACAIRAIQDGQSRAKKRKPPLGICDVELGSEPGDVVVPAGKKLRNRASQPQPLAADVLLDSEDEAGIAFLAEAFPDPSPALGSSSQRERPRDDGPRAPAPPAPEAVEPLGSSAPEGRQRHRLEKWASFAFSRKTNPRGIEVTCRFHRLNDKTLCKKFLRCDPGNEHQAVTKLRHWCNQALRFDRQRAHIRMPLRDQDIPDESVVFGQKLEASPPSKAPTDVELDADAGPVAPKAKAQRQRKAKPKPKAAASSSSSSSDSSSTSNSSSS